MKTAFKIFAFLLTFSFLNDLSAQAYNSAIGLRFGYPTSVSYKKFLNERNAFEAFVGFRGYAGYSYIGINAAYQIHNPIESVQNLSWYYGVGAGLNFYSFDAGFTGGSTTGINISGYLGLDYKIESIPLNLSVDWVPTYFVSGYGTGFAGGYGALSARYVLNPKS